MHAFLFWILESGGGGGGGGRKGSDDAVLYMHSFRPNVLNFSSPTHPVMSFGGLLTLTWQGKHDYYSDGLEESYNMHVSEEENDDDDDGHSHDHLNMV